MVQDYLDKHSSLHLLFLFIIMTIIYFFANCPDAIKHEMTSWLCSRAVSSTDRASQGNDNSVVTRILKVIQEEPSLSQKKIADVIGEKYSTVKYYMESMKKSRIIKREGSSQKENGLFYNYISHNSAIILLCRCSQSVNSFGLAVPVFTAFFLCNASFLKSAKAACIFSSRSVCSFYP